MNEQHLYDERWDRKEGANQIYAMVQGPTTVFVYWEVDEDHRDIISRHFCSEWSNLPLYVVVYDVTDCDFNGRNASAAATIRVHQDAENWYIHGLTPGRNYVVDLATTTLNDEWFSILRSNVVQTPPAPKAGYSPCVHFGSVRAYEEPSAKGLKGYLNLVLHAHLPFVRHVDREDRIEERWLFEALTETYIPLLQVLYRLLEEGVDFRMTISLSPPLISMLADPLLKTRYMQHLSNLIGLARQEVERTREQGEVSEEQADCVVFHQLANTYLQRFVDVELFWQRYDGNMLAAFTELHLLGKVELITSAATHAFLPYVQTEQGIRAQIRAAVDVFKRYIGVEPRGIWLPECGYDARVEPFLKEFGLRYFFADTHALTSATPQPIFGTYAPILTPGKTAVFARDDESGKQVWSSESGYPGDPDYREYYRDAGFDLSDDDLYPFLRADGLRLNTGIKYYRITGKDVPKEPYDVERAREKAAIHAGNFLFNRQHQAAYAQSQMGKLPVITAPYDAELFGHWWYEGPIFLDMLFRKIHFDQMELSLITPSEYLSQNPQLQTCELQLSTWGRGGFGDVWLNSRNDWIYPVLHRCEREMVKLAREHGVAGSYRGLPSASEVETEIASNLIERALQQAARELMLAESSDFAFIMDTQTTVDYAIKRTKHHTNRFKTLVNMIRSNNVDSAFLTELEELDNLFPDVDYRVYHPADRVEEQVASPIEPQTRVLMLSWEFPPMTVGGLARHVYDLSRYLTRAGCEVHVVTTAVDGYPLDEIVEGVHVHRVRVMQPHGGAFIDFILQLNLAMLDQCRHLIEEQNISFDLLHAHDWLVSDVARSLKQRYQLPLIATIHATEHGRNQGIFTDEQRHIHQREWALTNAATRVVVCSTYMKREVMSVFHLPDDKIEVLPNGVDVDLLLHRDRPTSGHQADYPAGNKSDFHGPRLLFIGRLVREKGIHVLLSALSSILHVVPDVTLIIVGKGPMEENLRRQAQELGISNRVEFAGFVDDEQRNELLHTATVAVFPSLYEPFGIVALEAMAAGTPIVAADVGGLSDIVSHRHNGLKAYPNDPNSLALQVTALLQDETLRQHIISTARNELSRYDWARIAEHTLCVYRAATAHQVSGAYVF